MIMDKELEFSNKQAVTASAVSTNVINLGPRPAGGTSFGSSTEVPLAFSVDTTFTAAGAATLSIEVRSSDNENMSSPIVHQKTDAIPVASLTAGADLSNYLGDLRIPKLARQYVALYYTVATGPFTAGAISARGATALQTND